MSEAAETTTESRERKTKRGISNALAFLFEKKVYSFFHEQKLSLQHGGQWRKHHKREREMTSNIDGAPGVCQELF